ncbi:MAG: class I SAM-dependent methyltransferase [Candidatus Omnitrophota bacterium]
MSKTKQAYSDYYKDLDTAIGGDERFAWVNDVLLKTLTGKAVLDVGCGEGSLLKMLKDKDNNVFGIDASETGRLSCLKKGVDCAVIDISAERFPCDNDSFDLVLCLETIEHIENPHHCVWEIKRVLKEGGVFIVSIPNQKILHPYIYPGLFDLKNFKKFLELNSFEIKEIKGWGQAGMLNKTARWLKSKNSALAGSIAAGIHFLSRKRNLLMRKHIGCPLNCSYSVNFICLNRKKDKTLLEEIALQTRPGK